MRRSSICTGIVLSLVAGIALLELVAYAVLPALGGQPTRLFLIPDRPPRCQLDAVDVFFGYSAGECDTPAEIVLEGGLAVMDDPRTLDASAPGTRPDPARTVLVLGGSTTDPITMSSSPEIGFDGWALLLARRCREAVPGCRVVNGGRAAFTSAQELLLLVRDGLAYDPDVVVSLNGINEWYFRKDPALAAHPVVTRRQRNHFLNMCHGVSPYAIARWRRVLPNAQALATDLRKRLGFEVEIGHLDGDVEGRVGDCLLNLGPGLPLDQQDPVTIWRRNVASMEALVRARGGTYLVVLQPTLGIGEYAPETGHDAELRADMMRTRSHYHTLMDEVYVGLREACASLSYCVDLTDLFVGESDVYADPRHPNRKGNALEAAAIWSSIEPQLVPMPPERRQSASTTGSTTGSR